MEQEGGMAGSGKRREVGMEAGYRTVISNREDEWQGSGKRREVGEEAGYRTGRRNSRD